MLEEHHDQFTKFKQIHDAYQLNRSQLQSEFNAIGKEIMEVIREYEDRLCAGMERGMYGKYSDKVSQKFWDRVKKEYPLIELVGVEIVKAPNN